eukprot:6204292-Pleurochrysis_carterae.AAC.1
MPLRMTLDTSTRLPCGKHSTRIYPPKQQQKVTAGTAASWTDTLFHDPTCNADDPRLSYVAKKNTKTTTRVYTLNEYATCYISCYTRTPRNAKGHHVGVFGALYRAISNVRSKFEISNAFSTY